MEGCGNRTAGVAGRGDQDRDRAVRLVRQARQAGGQETRTEVLERGGRAVEQLQGRHARLDRHDRRREVEGLAHDVLELGGQRVSLEEGGEQPPGDVRERFGPVEVLRLERREALGNEQPAVGGDAAPNGRGERCLQSAVARAPEVHQPSTSRAPSVSIAETQWSLARLCSAKASTMATLTPSA